MRSALAALLLLLQDPVIDRLGDPDPAVREQAAHELRKGRSLETLQRARDHSDPEVRGRVRALIVEVERELAQEAREKEQRPQAMKRLASDRAPLDGMAVTDGASFLTRSRAWPAGGTVFETAAEKLLDGELEWDVVDVAGREVERCGRHSPRLVYLPGPVPEAPRVRIKGMRRWHCETPIEFKDPRMGETWRRGGVTVEVRWPEIVVRTDQPIPVTALEKSLSWADVKVTLRIPQGTYDVIGGGGGGGGRYGTRFGGKKEDLAWCGCVGRPSAEKPEPPERSKEHVVRSLRHEDVPLANVASIRLSFRKPVEEPFEITSMPLK